MLGPAAATLSLGRTARLAAPPSHLPDKFPLFPPTRCPSSSLLLPSTVATNGNVICKPLAVGMGMSPRHSVRTAVAVEPNQLSDDPSSKEQAKTYYFLVANAKFMLDEEEHFKEQLYERLRNFGERNREQDFWLVIEPKFLDKFPNITKRLKRPAVALVSTDGPWIRFMKLRLDRVLSESYEANSLEEALNSTPVKLEFEKPQKWTAPYPKYEFGWWEPFLAPGSGKPKA
ncbi:PREDICTED: uncharacterized protein LOC104612952 isoform X2 [Nelumbo nucifera]|uniref:Uncharacterized protein LOC104612952 isoform X2 n=2 Tax=Nelumbo nucifera TaxID=4432 RepID=A0A1U8BC58_NELNU|nr:PREDICTED: uncharacterized protein LOC104612952 isoform X2 [Nelumbo nucifera]